jgi:hypothetical protein
MTKEISSQRLRYLGDELGSLLYFGQCSRCRVQFLSCKDKVLRTPRGWLCYRCVLSLKDTEDCCAR